MIVFTNSSLFLVLVNRSSILSAASSVLRLLRAFLIMSTASSSSLSRRRSSLLVPDLAMSIAGNTLFSDNFLSSTSSFLSFLFYSSNTTSSILLPVSTSAVASIVRLPPSLILRAAPKNLLGIWSAAGSRPPDNVRPLA